MTSNCSEEFYDQIGYDKMVEKYKNTLNGMFAPEAKKARHDEVFPNEKQEAFSLGA